MAKDYKQSAKGAHKMSDDAKASSKHHSRDLARNKKRAKYARENVKQILERQRKREENAEK